MRFHHQPSHGFFRLLLAVFGYAFVAVAVTVGLVRVGLPGVLSPVALLLTCLLLAKPFLRLCRHLSPSMPGAD